MPTTVGRQHSIVFLDVDGVVNALSSRHGFGDGRRASIDGFALTLSRKLGSHLDRLPADLRWLTTWGEQANEIGARMGLRALPLATVPPANATSNGSWKLEAVVRIVEQERRRFVWIDDDAIGADADEWLAQAPAPGLFVRPRSHRGLTPADVDVIERFLDG